MKGTEIKDSKKEFEDAFRKSDEEKYMLRLYVTGMTLKSTEAVRNIKRICENNLKGRYELEVIDIYQQPEFAREEQLIATPTLIKKLPLPLRRLIGDMSNTERILVGLDLRSKNKIYGKK